jgi:aarF domain-containing kinase
MRMMKVWKPVLGSILGGTGLSLLYYTQTDPGGARSLDFWRTVGPMYLQYRYVQFLNDDIGWINDGEAGVRYNDLHNRYTDDVKIATYRLRGFYLKSAQLMSIQDNFIPKQYMKWLKDTQDNVPSEFSSQDEVKDYVTKILKDELNLDFDEVFEEFDFNPLGVASIGQVHRAKLRDSHQEVAVKFQLPHMESRFRADIATMKMFCQIATPQFLPSFNEIEKQFCTGDEVSFDSSSFAPLTLFRI